MSFGGDAVALSLPSEHCPASLSHSVTTLGWEHCSAEDERGPDFNWMWLTLTGNKTACNTRPL